MLPSKTMIWQPEFTDKTLSRKPGAVHLLSFSAHSKRCKYHLHGLKRKLSGYQDRSWPVLLLFYIPLSTVLFLSH
ncbi:TPA: hypothetical protein HL449_18425 [Escherichia coli]|nr:hypothetical protein [Escherichia coli]TLH03839.1 hypothetical protein EWT55_04950 [Escherichia coli O25b:H4]EEW1137612.1 hypothetical protein [Escherichia coli]EFB1856682.1 hypothetical protein [Escherichia coli]EFG7881745.1 hypothetical protein [Escherichia coli]